MKRILYILPALMFLAIGQINAQSKFTFEIEQSLSGDSLVLDYFVQKTSGPDFVLGSCNLPVNLSNDNVVVDSAIVDRNVPMLFDQKSDASSYLTMTKGIRGFVNFSVRRFTSGSGTGQMVDATRKQIGRIVVPISDACGTNDVTWLTGPGAVLDFSGKSIKENATFVNSTGFPLCAIPATPSIVAQGPTTICKGSTLELVSNSSDPIVWYKDGVAMTQTDDTIQVTEAGVYEAVATKCATCVSQASAQVSVQVEDAPMVPTITYQSDTLFASSGTKFQWYRNGQPISGATQAFYNLNGNLSGSYSVKSMNDCGEETSHVFAMTSVDPLAYGFSLSAFPNPFNTNTTLRYNLPREGRVQIEMSNIISQEVVTLLDVNQSSGEKQLNIRATDHDWASGVYVVSMRYEGKKHTLKLVNQK